MFKKIVKNISKNMEHKANKKEYFLASRYAELGNKTWQFLLAKMYETGTTVVTKDILTAYVWYYFSNQNGMKEAEERLMLLKSQLSNEQLNEANDIISRNMHYVNQKTKNLLVMMKRLFC
ncbi:MAG: hypothetical protein A3F11_07105 [Gammaproteobacteria bacterium RIFCSPHIGHO2_12_FULL_37_14]|nr:MAG: hypothetical protein A3F11_07105 [Gammaproteobacteria bacterium RIFCSPHIGHO2_12_FULL_37_14]